MMKKLLFFLGICLMSYDVTAHVLRFLRNLSVPRTPFVRALCTNHNFQKIVVAIKAKETVAEKKQRLMLEKHPNIYIQQQWQRLLTGDTKACKELEDGLCYLQKEEIKRIHDLQHRLSTLISNLRTSDASLDVLKQEFLRILYAAGCEPNTVVERSETSPILAKFVSIRAFEESINQPSSLLWQRLAHFNFTVSITQATDKQLLALKKYLQKITAYAS